MKKLIVMLIMIFGFGFAHGQDYPKYTVENDTLRVVFTIEQAQKIDNDLELLSIYRTAVVNYDSVTVAYIKVVDNLNNQVAELKSTIKIADNLNATNDTIISNLHKQIENYEQDLLLAKNQSDMKDQIINNQKKEIRKQKILKVVGVVSTVVIAATVILLISQ